MPGSPPPRHLPADAPRSSDCPETAGAAQPLDDVTARPEASPPDRTAIAISSATIDRVIHERLVEHPETEIRRVLDYCGLDWEDACLNFHQTKRAVRTASSEQVRRRVEGQGGRRKCRHCLHFLAPGLVCRKFIPNADL